MSNVNELEAARPKHNAHVGASKPAEHFTEARSDDRSVRNAAHGLQVVQVDTLGKGGMFALWASAFIAAGSLVAVVAMCFWIDRLSARVFVLEYDTAHVQAQLAEKNIIEHTGH